MATQVNVRNTARHDVDLSLATQQLVVIAKPSPRHHYRQLASAFQSCSCSRSILKPCLDAIRALSDESKRFGILQELGFAADYETGYAEMNTLPAGDFYQAPGRKEADTRFPYTTSVLASGMAACCLEQGHPTYNCSLEARFHRAQHNFPSAAGPVYEECDKRITVGVIDITDPSKPRYCFLKMHDKCIKCGLWWFCVTTHMQHIVNAPWDIMDFTPISCDGLLPPRDLASDDALLSLMETLRGYPAIDIASLFGMCRCPNYSHVHA
jgi:hypothetical protein